MASGARRGKHITNYFQSHTRSKLLPPTISDYKLLRKVGEGKFGIVDMALHKATGALLAIKKVRKESVRLILGQFIQEVKLQLYCQHPQLLQLYTILSDIDHIYLVLEYMEEGNLFSTIKK